MLPLFWVLTPPPNYEYAVGTWRLVKERNIFPSQVLLKNPRKPLLPLLVLTYSAARLNPVIGRKWWGTYRSFGRVGPSVNNIRNGGRYSQGVRGVL